MTIKSNLCHLNDFINLEFDKKIITCRGAACGDPEACCSRTLLNSKKDSQRLSLLLGGCTAVNELSLPQKKETDSLARDSYKEIWQFINHQLPRSTKKNRLIIPRAFAVSEQAFFLAKLFEKLGIPVYVDNICENDILSAQSDFDIDVCAPLIGAVGQFKRLAQEQHGLILAPQIDFLPTQNLSLGKTCTTNQGGIAIATNLAKQKYKEAKIHLFNLNLKEITPAYLTNKVQPKLEKVFEIYNLDVSREEFKEAVSFAIDENQNLKDKVAGKVAEYLEETIEKKQNLALVCAREYILNPGIYDSHIGKLLKDKGIVAIPAYAIASHLDKAFSYLYWRNPHDLVTKINAIANKKLHQFTKNSKLKEIIKKIETGKTASQLSVVQVSTFRCGPDTVIVPTLEEITKKHPSLFIQSDAMIKELAHLENRVNTYINQLKKKLHQEFQGQNFKIEIMEEFHTAKVDKKKDVIYVPTLHDNRTITSVFRAAGLTTIDNYEDQSYSLEHKVRLGRKHAGDSVCAPLAAVFADILLAVEDFIKKKKNNDPLVEGKTRVLVFDNKGSGPCRQGQYEEMHRLLLARHLNFSNELYKRPAYAKASAGKNASNKYTPKANLLVALEKEAFNFGLDEWAVVQSFQGLIMQAILHSILIKAGANCDNYEKFQNFFKDYQNLKKEVFAILEKQAKPQEGVLKMIKKINKNSKPLAALFKYFGYGLYKNNGLRKLLTNFAEKWLPYEESDEEDLKSHQRVSALISASFRGNKHKKTFENNKDTKDYKNTLNNTNTNKIKIHIEGEVYIRTAQVEDIFNTLVDSLGFSSFELTYSPLWSYMELSLEQEIINQQDKINFHKEALEALDLDQETNLEKKNDLLKKIKKTKKNILKIRLVGKSMREILAKPLYKAARVPIPHPVTEVLEKTKKLIPSLKPHGELLPYVGEAILKLEEGTDLFLNVAPEGCMVASMGQLFSQPILDATKKQAHIKDLFTLNGEVDKEQLQLALLKTLGPEKYYSKNN